MKHIFGTCAYVMFMYVMHVYVYSVGYNTEVL